MPGADDTEDRWAELRAPFFPLRGIAQEWIIRSPAEFRIRVPGFTAAQLEMIEDLFMSGTRVVRLLPLR